LLIIMCDISILFQLQHKHAYPHQIELGFLMVGHTHEDIDQFFSKFSQYLRHNAAHTLPGNEVKLVITVLVSANYFNFI
jgi:hypothetical protein